DDLPALYNKIDDAEEANDIVNSLKICDPAVGSGHFLVSALNEIIAIKHELKILRDRQGRRLKEYNIEVVNDELVITDEDGELFEYRPGNQESQRVQEALFHEKQTIIEGCLFGVDINPNSVKICRLRLWIELLKHAYYKDDGQLETLPNIDINIKCGNSLVSRFALDADLGQALKKSKWNIEDYQVAVQSYRRAETGEEKYAMRRLINDIKSGFSNQIYMNDPIKKRLDRLGNELYHRFTGPFLFEPEVGYGKHSEDPEKKREREQQKLEQEIEKLQEQLSEKKGNEIFRNAFEWRFEFPEVLDNEGDFIGFDVVIGNPPYIRQEELGDLKNHLQAKYNVFAAGGDIFSYFYELSHNILCDQGIFSFINNTFDKTSAGKTLREFVVNNFKFERYIDFTDVAVFEEATTYPIILIVRKSKQKSNFKFFKYTKSNFSEKDLLYDQSAFIDIAQDKLNSSAWNFINSFEQTTLAKIQRNKTIGELYGKCFRGIITGLNEAFVTNNILGDEAVLKDVYNGKDLKKWSSPRPDKKMIVFESKSTARQFGKITEDAALEKMTEAYPEIFEHLNPFKEKASKRYDKGEYWWELRNCAYYDLFEKPKIIFPNLQNANKFAFDDSGIYLNAPAVFLPSANKALLAILNSKVVWYFLKSVCVIRSGGYIEVKPQYFEQIPIPVVSEKTKSALIELANEAIKRKKQNQKTEISEIETHIDQLVYQLYDLTEEEIQIIENSIK
ncbi:MAG: class I SAM-dependent DNA methyltransferase, partial [Bacteroidetes bacterium]